MITKTYTIILKEGDTTTLTRKNDGFNAIELLGVLQIAKNDIINQIKGIVEADIDFVERKVVIDENEKTEKTEK
jgi:hypothetical protein